MTLSEGPPTTDPNNDEDGIVCPHCIKPIDRFDHFCPSCGGPVTAHASIDPIGQIYAAGRAYQNATSSRPSRIVFIGILLIFGPILPLCIWGLVTIGVDIFTPETGWTYSLDDHGDLAGVTHYSTPDGWFADTLNFLMIAGFTVLYVMIMWKVARRFFAPVHDDQPEDDHDEDTATPSE